MIARHCLALLTVTCLLVSGCATTSATPTPVAPTPPNVSSDGASATNATASVPDGNAQSATTTLVLDANSSQARYRAQEQLVGRNLPSEAVGTSAGVSGSIVVTPEGVIAADQSQIQVDLSRLTSDESRRDNFIKGSTLQTGRFPTATFVPRQAHGLPTPLPTSGQVTFQLDGDLTVHGVTKPVSWQVTAQFDGANVSGSATTNVNISDFGMTPPKAGPVLSIQDGLTLELAFNAAREA